MRSPKHAVPPRITVPILTSAEYARSAPAGLNSRSPPRRSRSNKYVSKSTTLGVCSGSPSGGLSRPCNENDPDNGTPQLVAADQKEGRYPAFRNDRSHSGDQSDGDFGVDGSAPGALATHRTEHQSACWTDPEAAEYDARNSVVQRPQDGEGITGINDHHELREDQNQCSIAEGGGRCLDENMGLEGRNPFKEDNDQGLDVNDHVGQENDHLPHGWNEAIDEETGHTYFFSDTRSTWVRPTEPATPRDIISAPSAVIIPGTTVSLDLTATALEDQTSSNHAVSSPTGTNSAADLVTAPNGLASALRTVAKRNQPSRPPSIAGCDAEIRGKIQDNPKFENLEGELNEDVEGVAKAENAGVQLEVEVSGHSPEFERAEGTENGTGGGSGHERDADDMVDAEQCQDPTAGGISPSPPGIDDARAALAAFAKAANGLVVGQDLPRVAANDRDKGGSSHAQKRSATGAASPAGPLLATTVANGKAQGGDSNGVSRGQGEDNRHVGTRHSLRVEHDRLDPSDPGLDPVSAAFAAFRASAATPSTATTTPNAVSDHRDKTTIHETSTMNNEDCLAPSEPNPEIELGKYRQGYCRGGGYAVVGGAVDGTGIVDHGCNLNVSRAETEKYNPEGIVEPLDSGGPYYDDFEGE